MKSILSLILLTNLILASSSAQLSKTIPDFGKIDISEIKMNDCSFSPGASAMNLLKYEDVTLSIFPNSTAQVVTTTRYRIKIFKKEGYKQANIAIDYENDDSKITNIEGATYNIDENGQVKKTPLERSDIFDFRSGGKIQRTITFTFPQVKEGSVIEYQYTRKDKRSHFIPSWYFQDKIPGLLSVCKITRPQFSMLENKITGDRPIEQEMSRSEDGDPDKKILKNYYAMRNVPAFTPEPYMSSSRDYRYRIDFKTSPLESHYQTNLRDVNDIWQGANSWLLYSPYFGGQFDAKIPGSKKFIDSVKDLDDLSAKINAVYKYVKKKVKWNNCYILLSRDLDEVWKEGEGTSAEINLSILNLLRKCGVRCFPVLYSTRLHGKVDYEFADLSQFNTVNIAVVNNKKFNLLDGTNPWISYETPPLNVANRTGMLIDPINHTRINIDFDRKLFRDSIYIYASIDSLGMLRGNSLRKYFDLARSSKLQDGTNEADDEYEKKVMPANSFGIKTDTTYQLNKENELLPLIEVSRFHYELLPTNEFYLLNPFLFAGLTKTPFIDTTRKTDIDFVSNTSSVVHMEIKLPKEIMVEKLGTAGIIQMPDSSVSFRCHYEEKNDTVYINSSFEINEPFFEKDRYPALRKCFDNLYNLINEQFIFRRK